MHDPSFEGRDSDTIVAVATAAGQGGVGVVRVSGPLVPVISQAIAGKLPAPRYAYYATFHDEASIAIDMGLALYFPAPHSFTGEHVLELQGHGGPILLDQLVQRCVQLGARLARPGEFSERAFLNGKMDLAQAEAVADLISASTTQAAKCALQSLKGEFSKKINALNAEIISVRMYIESAIDFPDEEIEFLQSGEILQRVQALDLSLTNLLSTAKHGVRLKEGLKVAIVGEPNVGKSSLLNALCGEEVAIVSPIPGTTRDIVKEQINIEGIPLEVIDTAGIREGGDSIEEEGMKRANARLNSVDQILYVTDHPHAMIPERLMSMLETYREKVLTLVNKIDLLDEVPGMRHGKLFLSAKTQEGIVSLRQALKAAMGDLQHTEGHFIARRRHVDAIERAQSHVSLALSGLQMGTGTECVAEELRLAHLALCEITGEFSADDLLGKIFSEFCIGK